MFRPHSHPGERRHPSSHRGGTDLLVIGDRLLVAYFVAEVEGDELVVVGERAVGGERRLQEMVVGGPVEQLAAGALVDVGELTTHDDPEDLHATTIRPTLPPRLTMLDPDRRSHVRALSTAMLVTVLWSSSWVLIRIGFDDEALPPITFAGMRYTLAAVVLLAWVASRPRTRSQLVALDVRTLRRLAVLGVVYYALTQGAQFVAIDSQPAATSSLMLAPTPFFVGVLSQRSIGERVGPRQLFGAILIILGALVFFAGDLGATVVGMIASVIGLGANVTGSLMGRAVNRRQDLAPVIVTVVSMTVGAMLLLATGLSLEGLPSLSWTAVGIIVWLAVVNTAWAFTMWNASLRRLGAVESAAINNTMLIQIALLAWVFLGESPGVVGGVGIVIVSVGALLAQGLRPTPRRQ